MLSSLPLFDIYISKCVFVLCVCVYCVCSALGAAFMNHAVFIFAECIHSLSVFAIVFPVRLG